MGRSNGKSNGKTASDEQDLYGSMEDAIIGELRAFGAAGVKHEEHRALVMPRVEDFDDDEYEETKAELQERGVIIDGEDGSGTIALAGAKSDGAEQAAEATPGADGADDGALDTLPVLAALQLLGEAGGSVDDLQREIEAAGADRHPRGVIYAAALAAVNDGKARREGASEADARFWLADPEDHKVMLERRVKLLQAFTGLLDPEDATMEYVTLGEVGELGATAGDLDALKTAGLLTGLEDVDGDDEDRDDPTFALKPEALVQLVRAGATALAMLTLPAPEASTAESPQACAPADQNAFARAAREQVEIQLKRADTLQAMLNTIKDNLRRAELKVDWFLSAPPPAAPPEEEIDWKETRTVDAAEKGAILEEIMAIERTIVTKEAEFSGLKEEFKATISDLQAKIKALKEAAESNSRTVVIRARKERDWEKGVLRILAIDDGRMLEEKPLPKGEQRTIPTEAPAAAPASPPAAPASAEAIERFKAEMAEKGAKVETAAQPEAVHEVASTPTTEPGAPPPASTSPTPAAPVAPAVEPLFDSLYKKDVYGALRLANRLVDRRELGDLIAKFKGRPIGPAALAKCEDAAEELVLTGHLVKEGICFRVLGAPAAPPPPRTSAKDRVWEALKDTFAPIADLKTAALVSDEEFKAEIEALKKAGRIATLGRGMGTKYRRAGAPQAEAQA